MSCAQENERRELLQMSDPQLADVARVCNRYPDIELNFDVVGGESVTAGEPVQLSVTMERTLADGTDLAPVHAPRLATALASPCIRPYLLVKTYDTIWSYPPLKTREP